MLLLALLYFSHSASLVGTENPLERVQWVWGGNSKTLQAQLVGERGGSGLDVQRPDTDEMYGGGRRPGSRGGFLHEGGAP
jgi:hypothetical protein